MLDKLETVIAIIGLIAFSAIIMFACAFFIYIGIDSGSVGFLIFCIAAVVFLLCTIIGSAISVAMEE